MEEEEDLLPRDRLLSNRGDSELENRADTITNKTLEDKNISGHTASVQVRYCSLLCTTP